MTKAPLFTPWAGSPAPTESTLRQHMAGEGLVPYAWSNGPFDRYATHAHEYNKVIYVVRGSITFGLPEFERSITLQAGDRLGLPATVLHNAEVGAEGVLCLEAHA